MIRQAFRWAWRAATGLLLLPWRYRRTFWHLWRQSGGCRRAWRFWQVKVFARGERVGLQLLDPVSLLWPDWTPYPRMLEIEVTNRCHLRCPMCERTYFPNDYRHNDLHYDQFVHLMGQFPDLRYINLTGEGSSFLNPFFPEMLNYCRQHNIYTTVIDSFTALTDKQMRLLITSGVKKVPISFDAATPETYAKVRVGGNFERVLGKVRWFLEERKRLKSPTPEVIYRYIFYRDNVADIPLYPELIYRITKGLRTEGIDNMVEFAALLEFEQTRDWVVEVDPAMMRETEAKLHAYGLPHAWSHPSHVPGQKRPMQECAAWAEPYCMSGGFIMPCCAVMMSNRRPFLEQHALGNVFVQDFQAIWNSPRYREFRCLVPRRTGPVPILCQGCRAFDTTARERQYGVAEEI